MGSPRNFFFFLPLERSSSDSKGYEFGPSNCCQSGSTVMLGIHPFTFIVSSWQIFCEALLLYFPALGREGLSSEAILGSGQSGPLAACLPGKRYHHHSRSGITLLVM